MLALEFTFSDAAVVSRYTKRRDGSKRIFGGYNVWLLGDLYQLPPIPASAAVFTPITDTKTEAAKAIQNMFWSDTPDSINSFVELTIQKRVEDPWYADVLNECRMGQFSEDSYNFLHGFPTEHCGSWRTDGTVGCGNHKCSHLTHTWRRIAEADNV